MIKYVKEERRLSIFTDILIFVLLSLAAFLILSIFKEIMVASSLSSDTYMQVENLSDLTEVENVEYVNKIKEEFFVNIKYGKSQEEIAKTINATVLDDSGIINNNLKSIYSALSKYNKAMFSNFNKEGYKLNIILLDDFNNENLALASRNNLNQFTIYLSNVARIDRALHHEMCHILEYYMADKGVRFNDWEILNPEEFKYVNSVDNISSDFVYYFSKYAEENIDETYFVTKYAKVNAKEDRAEIFAEIMSTTQDLIYIKDKTPIYYKYISIFNTFKLNIPEAKFNNYYNIAF